MLSRSPSVFDYDAIAFKELEELNSLEQAFYAKFLYAAYDKDKTGLLWDLNPDELLAQLHKKDDYVWLVYHNSKLVGFWVLTDIDNQPVLFYYVAPEYQGGVFDNFMAGFFATLGTKTNTAIMVDLTFIDPARRIKTYGTEADRVECSKIESPLNPEVFTHLFEYIKPFYN